MMGLGFAVAVAAVGMRWMLWMMMSGCWYGFVECVGSLVWKMKIPFLLLLRRWAVAHSRSQIASSYAQGVD